MLGWPGVKITRTTKRPYGVVKGKYVGSMIVHLSTKHLFLMVIITLNFGVFLRLLWVGNSCTSNAKRTCSGDGLPYSPNAYPVITKLKSLMCAFLIVWYTLPSQRPHVSLRYTIIFFHFHLFLCLQGRVGCYPRWLCQSKDMFSGSANVSRTLLSESPRKAPTFIRIYAPNFDVIGVACDRPIPVVPGSNHTYTQVYITLF